MGSKEQCDELSTVKFVGCFVGHHHNADIAGDDEEGAEDLHLCRVDPEQEINEQDVGNELNGSQTGQHSLRGVAEGYEIQQIPAHEY